MRATGLKTAHLYNPIGIDIRRPFLSWTAEDGIVQTAFEISAAVKGEEIWNSGKISDREMHMVYGGPSKSRMRIRWSVKLWDEDDREGEWSESAFFEYGFLEKSDWKAKWINPEIFSFDPEKHQPASYLKREFVLDHTEQARIYATAHGIYALFLNGERIKENVLTPGTSEYGSRLPYQVFDVTHRLRKGKNKIEVVLGDGWYRGSNGNTGTRNVFGTDLAFLLQLEMEGKVKLITDEHWLASQNGPVTYNDLQLGERVDARKIPDYHGVKTEHFGYQNLISANTVPLKEKEHFTAKLRITSSGKKVLDFGQNMAGYVSFRLYAKAGQKIRMTHGEYTGKDGEFSDANLQTIGRKSGELHQVVEYVCKEGLNEYTPLLCIFGFQYVLLETEIEVDGSEFTAHAVYSDMEETAQFSCDLPLVNQLFRNAVWSQKSNFVDVPIDCPTRERSGWTGDAALFCRTGLTLMDAYPVYERWLSECRVDQYPDGRVANISPRRSPKPGFMDALYDGSCAWGDASVIVPYTMYRLYGDRQILEDNYMFAKRWLAYCEKKAKKSRLRKRWKRNPYKNYIIDTGIHYGEWLEAGISMQDAMKDVILKGVPEIATAYFARSCQMMSEIAAVLEQKEDEKKYRNLAACAKKAYHFLEVCNGHIESERQCRYIRPLQMGLLEKEDALRASEDLNELVIKNKYHLNTGFLTTAHLCAVLAEYGYLETAYRVLLQEDLPGWLYQVKEGATTVWESWEGNTGSTGVASLNHYSKGAVVSWLIEGICGIRVEGQRITIKPQPFPLMKQAKAVYLSPVGRIESGWNYDGERVAYEIIIPANTTAVFLAPDGISCPLHAGKNIFTI
ncbi:MAG: family 78 glycoside hydrolase catalytic domain [Blautia sp.]|nr:family 78 glycoside hydrolase catalytic domain [Blautia sp.]